MAFYIVRVRKQCAYTGIVEAETASEARYIARHEPEKVDWEGLEEIPQLSPLVVMSCEKDKA